MTEAKQKQWNGFYTITGCVMKELITRYFKIEAQYYERFHDSTENSVINRFHKKALKFISLFRCFTFFIIFLLGDKATTLSSE